MDKFYESSVIKNRIQPIDGLRTIAAFGVVWIHIWMFFGNPDLKIGSINFYQLITFLGNGVDYFFVISGFCMYLMASKIKMNFKGYLQFIWRRFLRIAPAFYVSVLIYAAIIKFANPDFQFVRQVFYHLLFLNNVVTGNTISGPFWSIGTEWHFYLLLPLFLFLANISTLKKALLLFSATSLSLFAIVNLGYLPYSWWEPQILVRFSEFAIGIYAAYAFINKKNLLIALQGWQGMVIGFAILYLGRLMKFTPVIQKAGSVGFLLRTFSETVMTAGFGLILFHVITQKSAFSRFLSTNVMTYLGRISFSVYLWHSLCIDFFLGKYLRQLPFGNFNPIPAFFMVSLLSILFAHFSYRVLESFYFKR